MNRYDPSKTPDSVQWLRIPEVDRIELVIEYHERLGEPLQPDALSLHSSIHVIVENQIAMEHDPVPQTIAKLTRQGLTRHEAIHAIGAVLIDVAGDFVTANESSWDNKAYKRRLTKLTAKRWSKGRW